MKNLMGLGWLLPGVNHKIDFGRNVRGVRGMPRRLLLIGHATAAATKKVPTQVSTLADMTERFGSKRTMLTAMWLAAFNNADKGLPIDVMAVSVPAGAATAHADCVISIDDGAVAVAGELPFYTHGVRLSVPAAVDDTADDLALALVDAINAADVQVSASVPEGNTTEGLFRVSARWPGETGNRIDLRCTYYDDDTLPKGVTVTVPAIGGGTLNPDLSGIADALAGYRATEIVCPFIDSASMNALEAELSTRWGHADMRDGQVIKVVGGSASAVTSWSADRNSDQGHTIPVWGGCTTPWETGAMAAAGIESVAASDPSMHYLGRPLVGYMGPRRGDGYTDDERNDLLKAGLSPLVVAADGTATLGRMVTDYTHTPQGADDSSRRELPWVKFMSYYRWFTVSEFALHYGAGWKLDPYASEPVPGVNIMTAALAKDVLVGNYTVLMKAGLVSQDLQGYIDSVKTEVDAANCLVNIEDEPKMLSPYYQTGIISYPVAS